MEKTKIMKRDAALSEKALYDYLEKDDTDVICPKCGKKPICKKEVDKHGKIERVSVLCGCGCILNGEVFL